MIVTNANVFREEGFVPGDIAITDGRFSAQGGGEVLDAAGCYAIPGLIDIHLHGCMHLDFSDASVEEINRMAAYQAQNGVTAICPTTMTLAEDTLATACRHIAQSGGEDTADLVGIYLEGPFLSPQKLGAQNPAFVRLPDAAMVRRLQTAAGGRIKLLAVAPELDGALDMIEQLQGEVTCSVAHTTADYDTAAAAFRCGARQVTHLYNAMPPLTHRAPGVIGAALDAPDCRVELICDGVHIHPAAVRAAFRLFGGDRIIFISDSMMATGLQDGEYELGGLPVSVRGNEARLTNGGGLAGSVTHLMDCLRTAVTEMGIPLHTAVRCASVNPAKAVGVWDRRGSLDVGKIADLVLLDADLRIRNVVLKGRVL